MVHISQQLRNSYDALENVTKWWDGYSMDSYRIAARPYQAFQSYMGEIYDKSKGTARSASAVKSTYFHETLEPQIRGAERTTSYSSLSPSHGLCPSDRHAERFIEAFTSYSPKPASWYQEASLPRYMHESMSYRPPVHGSTDTEGWWKDYWNEYRNTTVPRRNKGPSNLPRWIYPYIYFAGQTHGVRMMMPFTFTNYELEDQRKFLRYVIGRRVESPYSLQKWNKQRLAYRPYSQQLVPIENY